MVSFSDGINPKTAYLIHHLFLPPKLPQKIDLNPSSEIALLSTVEGGLREYYNVAELLSDKKRAAKLELATRALGRMQTIVDEGGALDAPQLAEQIASVMTSNSGQPTLSYICFEFSRLTFI